MHAPVFELDHKSALLVSFNPRAEKHGEDPKPAADLRFAMNTDSGSLAMFDPTLRGLLFHKSGANGVGDLANQAHDAPDLRFPKLVGPLAWAYEMIGATLTVHRGLGGKSDLVIQGCAVNKFTLDPQEGGTVIIGFRVQCHPSEQQNGKLSYMIDTDCEITLEPPAAKPPDLAEQGDDARARGRGDVNTLQSQWESFEREVVARGAPPVQRQEMRRAFYAGAHPMTCLVGAIGDDVSAAACEAMVAGWQQELRVFVDDVQAGKA